MMNRSETRILPLGVAEQLDRTALQLVQQAGKSRVTTCAFKAAAPDIARQVMADANSPLLAYWGLSRNFDENAQATIVHPKILTAIGTLAQVQRGPGDAFHAGLLHTYGYLFSRLKTPYGYKRERWVRPTIEQGLQIPSRTLRSHPRAGTLLQNLTYFLGRIVLRDSKRAWQRLDRSEADIAPSLRDYAFDALTVSRVSESVKVPAADGTSRRVTLLTDIVPFFPRQGSRKSGSQKTRKSLLIYAARDAAQPGTRLLTCFTVTADVVAALRDPATLGRNQPVRLRYNGVVPGLTGKTESGTRKLVEDLPVR